MYTKIIFLYLIFFVGIQFISAQEIAFKIREKDLIAEGIAYDSTSDSFFLSSIYKNKIVKIKDGKTTDFIKTDEYGYVGGVGLHVDNQNRILWACTGNILGNYYRTGIYAFNLETGDLTKKIYFPKDTIKTLFNDLAIARDGTVYITNTFENNIWKWSLHDSEPQRLIENGFPYANGIALDESNHLLYVATSLGIKRVNLNDLSTSLLELPSGNITAKNLDGIAFHKNSIIGIQDDVPENNEARVIRYFLSKTADAIERIEIIDKDNPLFYGPTTLTIGKGYLYVIANSQLDNLNQTDIKIIDKKKLSATIVLKYRLE